MSSASVDKELVNKVAILIHSAKQSSISLGFGTPEASEYVAKDIIELVSTALKQELKQSLEARLPQVKSSDEAEYKRDWINKHDKADEIVVAEDDKRLVAAIYYYPPEQHVADNKKIWRMIGTRMEIERLEKGVSSYE